MQFRHFFFTILFFFSCLCLGFAQQSTVLNHGGTVLTVKFSPVDNTLVASAGSDNTVKLWDLQNRTMIPLKGHTAGITSIAFSPDGNLIASGEGTVRLWDIRTQQNIATFRPIARNVISAVKGMAFSPDGQLLAIGALDVILWDVRAQKEIAPLPHGTFVESLAFSPNEPFLATGDRKGTITVWDVAERKVITELGGSSIYGVASVVFSPDGKTLAAASDDSIYLWAVRDWTRIGALSNYGLRVDSFDISQDSKILASPASSQINLWSLDNGQPIGSLTGDVGSVALGVSFSPDGKTLAYCDTGGAVRVENIASYLQTEPQAPIVKLLYILPNDRSPQPNIDADIDRRIKAAQQTFAEQMQQHGFGRKTFTYETDASGKAVVHHLKGQFNDVYYQNNSLTAWDELAGQVNVGTNIYIAFLDVSSELLSEKHVRSCGYGEEIGTVGGWALVPAAGGCVDGDSGHNVLVHELGHAFGLNHDFRSDTYFMSYGGEQRNQFSEAAAKWLDAHRYFNTNQTYFSIPPTIEMLKPRMALSGNIHLHFKITDPDGLHQAQLHTHTTKVSENIGYPKMIGYKSLSGETKNVRFVTTELTPANKSVILYVMDTYGNFDFQGFSIDTRTIKPEFLADVNGDGEVNIQDLVAVAAALGQTGENDADVNGDGEVNIQDLVAVAAALGEVAAAPAVVRQQGAAHLTQEEVQHWITQAQQARLTDTTSVRGIRFLEQLLSALIPKETALLPNYPNPFNPETWIPYQLATPADVTLTIYDIQGRVVRDLDLGHQHAGIYWGRSRAAYWDGRNAQGESVASGVYFYTLTAGDFTATRKLLIRK